MKPSVAGSHTASPRSSRAGTRSEQPALAGAAQAAKSSSRVVFPMGWPCASSGHLGSIGTEGLRGSETPPCAALMRVRRYPTTRERVHFCHRCRATKGAFAGVAPRNFPWSYNDGRAGAIVLSRKCLAEVDEGLGCNQTVVPLMTDGNPLRE